MRWHLRCDKKERRKKNGERVDRINWTLPSVLVSSGNLLIVFSNFSQLALSGRVHCVIAKASGLFSSAKSDKNIDLLHAQARRVCMYEYALSLSLALRV